MALHIASEAAVTVLPCRSGELAGPKNPFICSSALLTVPGRGTFALLSAEKTAEQEHCSLASMPHGSRT